jgi:hypothetical protein
VSARVVLLKLALASCERGDAIGAADTLRALIALNDDRPAVAPTTSPARAVTRGELASILSCTPEHVSHLISRGDIPASAVLGSGRGLRILVDVAIEALRRRTTTLNAERPTDFIESQGAEYVRRRGALRVVRGTR